MPLTGSHTDAGSGRTSSPGRPPLPPGAGGVAGPGRPARSGAGNGAPGAGSDDDSDVRSQSSARSGGSAARRKGKGKFKAFRSPSIQTKALHWTRLATEAHQGGKPRKDGKAGPELGTVYETGHDTPLRKHTLDVAAMLVQDGLHGRSIGYRTDPVSLARYKMYHSRWWTSVYVVAAVMHIALALCEKSIDRDTDNVPPWHAYVSGLQRRWMPAVTALLELVFLSVYVVDMWLWSRFMSNEKFMRHRWSVLRLFASLLIFADVCARFATGFHSMRFSRIVRPLMFICRMRNVRKMFSGCVKTFRRLIVVLSLIAFHIWFQGLIGFFLFGGQFFDSLGNSLYQLLVIATSTPHNLEVMLPYFRKSNASALFFVAFLVIDNLVLLRLVVAVSYKHYKQHTSIKTMKRLAKRRIALHQAFTMVSRDGVMERDMWHQMYRRLAPRMPLEVADMFFDSVSITTSELPTDISQDAAEGKPGEDSDAASATDSATGGAGDDDAESSGYESVEEVAFDQIGFQQFMELCALVNVRLRRKRRIGVGWVFETKRRVRHVLKYEAQVAGLRLGVEEICIDVLLILDTVQLYVEAAPDQRVDNETWETVGIGLLTVFCIETALYMWSLGWRRFWDSGLRRLDLACNLLGIIYYVVDSFDNKYFSSNDALFRLIMVARLLRSLRLLAVLEVARKVLITVKRVFPALIRLAFVFFTILYVFSDIGMKIYWDKLVPGSPELVGTPWYPVADELGFGTFASSLLTMFEVGLLARWTIVMDAAVKVTGNASAVFFFTYRIIVAIVYIPILVGFIVEGFVSSNARVELDHLRHLAHRQAKRDTKRAAEDEKRRIGALGSDDVRLSLEDEEEGEGDRRFKMVLKRKNSDVNYATLNVDVSVGAEAVARLEEEVRRAVARATVQEDRVMTFARKLMEAEARNAALLQRLQSAGVPMSPASQRRVRARTQIYARNPGQTILDPLLSGANGARRPGGGAAYGSRGMHSVHTMPSASLLEIQEGSPETFKPRAGSG